MCKWLIAGEMALSYCCKGIVKHADVRLPLLPALETA
jgi:hypothetical protein